MKILQLRFRNLNSLRGEFSIDFAARPFLDAGLFAVTGPTGAGKSTIFDALSISLYGETPRLKKRRTGGEGIAEIVSRHTADAWAEVEFEVPAGRYRSRWEVHRARGSVTGAFQQPRMRLSRIPGNPALDEELIEDKLSEVPDRISRLTGLDFTRFTRSVLLAQGAFAAFLEANAVDRADLLEKMTGSFIYSEVSRLAYERAKEEEQKSRDLQERRDAVEVMSEEVLAEARTVLDAAGERYRLALSRRDGLIKSLEQARRFRNLKEALDQTGESLSQLESRKETVQQIQSRLELHRRAAPYRGELQRFDLLTGERAAAEEEIAGMEDAAGILAAEETLMAEKLDKAQDDLKNLRLMLEQDRRKQGAAEKTEHSLEEKKEQLSGEDTRIRRLETRLQERLTEVSALEDRQQQIAARRNELKVLCEDAALKALSEKLDLFLLRQQEKVSLEQGAEGLRSELGALENRLAEVAAEPEDEGVETEMQSLRERVRREEAELAAGKDAAALQDELAALDVRLGDLSAFVPLLERDMLLEKELEERTLQEAALREDVRRAQQRADDLRLSAEEARRQFFSSAALQLRTELKRGAPCPVCGSKEHPAAVQAELFDEHPPEPAADTSAEDAYRNALISLRELEERVRGFAARSEELQNEARELRQRIDTGGYSRQEAENLRVKRDELAGELDVRRSREAGHARALAELAGMGDRLSTRLAEVSQRRDESAVLKERKRSLEEELSRNRGKQEAARQFLLQLTAQTGLDADSSGLAEEAEAAVSGYRAAWTEDQTLASEERDAALQSSRLKAEAGEYAAELEELRRNRAALAEELQSLQRGLEELTGGISVRELVERREGEVADGENLVEECRRVLTAAGEKRASLKGRLETARENQQRRVRQSEELERTLTEARRNAGFDSLEEFRSAFLEDAEERQREVEGFEHQLASLDERKRQLEKELAEFSAEFRDPSVLESDLEAAETEFTEAQRVQYEAQQRLDRDRENRALRRDLEEAIEAQRREYEVWWRLRELIGSARGDSFRRFAQGLTLDFLVSLANRHLHRFSGRYRLKRQTGEELSLEIVDTWQADTVRPVETLSGGETFLTSLSLALGLSELAGRKTRIDSLFLDEGFGTLDAETLETVLAALETLRSSGKLIGIISHVDALKDRVPVQIRVRRKGTGYSTLSVVPDPAVAG